MENELQRDPSSDALPWARPMPFPRPPLRGNVGTSCPRGAWEPQLTSLRAPSHSLGRGTAECLPPTGVLPLETKLTATQGTAGGLSWLTQPPVG